MKSNLSSFGLPGWPEGRQEGERTSKYKRCISALNRMRGMGMDRGRRRGSTAPRGQSHQSSTECLSGRTEDFCAIFRQQQMVVLSNPFLWPSLLTLEKLGEQKVCFFKSTWNSSKSTRKVSPLQPSSRLVCNSETHSFEVIPFFIPVTSFDFIPVVPWFSWKILLVRMPTSALINSWISAR